MSQLKHFDKIKRLGHDRTTDVVKNPEHELIFKEKLDGANFRAKVIETTEGEYKWLFGSRNVEYKKEGGKPDYSENVDGRFTEAIQAVREKVNPEYVAETYGTQHTFFFENMVPHSLDYPFEEMPQVIGFDIYNHELGIYKPVEAANEIFHDLGFKTAPVIEKKKVEEFEPENYEIPESQFRDGKMEGVVIINEGVEEDQKSGFNNRAKLVSEEFSEKHKKKTGARMSKEAVKGHEKLVSKYCTDARIEKIIHKMRDEGRELGMQMMENKEESLGLVLRVAKDIFEEESRELVSRNDTFNLRNFRDLIGDRCVYVLRQEITKNATENKGE